MKPSYDVAHLTQRLQQQAEQLKALLVRLPDHEAVTDVFDYVVGAQYGLTKALEIGFVRQAWNLASHVPASFASICGTHCGSETGQ
jgi:hypothetical protein